MKLERFITSRSDGLCVISLQPAMSVVHNGILNGSGLSEMDACYETFDKDGDGKLNLAEFKLICKALFRNDKGHVYPLPEDRARLIFQVFDRNGDGFIDKEEFIFCWNHWIKVIVRPVSAFLVVDVQNDFISGTLNISKCNAQQEGSEDWTDKKYLAKRNSAACRRSAAATGGGPSTAPKLSKFDLKVIEIMGSGFGVPLTTATVPIFHEVVEPINRLLEATPFDAVFYSLDWHPPDHVSFIDNVHMRELHPSSPVSADKSQVYDTVIFAGPPPMKQRLWPRHCVQDSWGAELHKDLKIVDGGVKVYKGTNPEVDSYSVFWDNKKLTETTLSTQLRMRGATDIYICGLAYDVCVGATAADALAIGYRAVLIDDASRGVDLTDIERTKHSIIKNNGVIVNSDEVAAMVEGRDRRPELGYKLALELKQAMDDNL